MVNDSKRTGPEVIALERIGDDSLMMKDKDSPALQWCRLSDTGKVLKLCEIEAKATLLRADH